MMVRPHLARRVLGVIAGSLLVVLLFSAAGALMTYLSMVMLSPTTVAGFQIDPNSGVIILALASVVAWVLTRPIKRITGMLSYAATGNPHQLSDQRRRAMAGLHRLTPLARWRRGSSHRVSDPTENPADSVTPTEPAGPSRPEQVTIARRRTNMPPGKPVLGSTPAPMAGEPVTTTIQRITPATSGRTPATVQRSPDAPTQVIPVVAAAALKSNWVAEPAGTATEQRPAAGHLHRQVWNGRGWVLADDDRVFHPARIDRPTKEPTDDTAVFRPPDPPPWAEHRRPETRTTSWPNPADDPRRT
jgi:hypothetical protein